MRAILLAGDRPEELGALVHHRPAAMLPLVDRPFLQHVIEYLVGRGVKDIEMVLWDHPQLIERFVGSGQRWGVSVTYHLARHAGELPSSLLDQRSPEPVVLGRCDTLPCFDTVPPDGASTAWYYRDEWTGWAWLSPVEWCALGDERGLELLCGLTRADVPLCLDIRSGDGVLEAHRAVLDKRFSVMLGGREVEPGVWLSRNVVMPSTVAVTPPVYIGENTRIERGVRLGPHAVIGSHCVIDRGSDISESVICPGSFVGEELEVRRLVVDHSRVLVVGAETSFTVTDPMILGALAPPSVGNVATETVSRLIGLALLMLLLPVVLISGIAALLAHPGKRVRRDCIRLPADPDPLTWRTFRLYCWDVNAESCAGGWAGPERSFFWRFLPGLWNVVRGDLRLVGVPPRTRDEVMQLPADWRDLYLQSKPGLIQEAEVRHGDMATEDDQYAAEAYYAAAASWRYDLRLAWLYVARLFSFGR